MQNWESSWDGVPVEMMNTYQPTQQDIQIISERIADRLANPLAKQKKQSKLTAKTV